MKRFVFITGSRADACPLTPVIDALGKHAIRVKTQGMYGHETALLSALKYHKPDAVILLGDRYETLVSASVASLLCIPIAHIHGGDETPHCVDNGFRNAISKLAFWHFPACELHATRLEGVGENPEQIFVCGAPGVDNLVRPIFSREECEKELGVKLERPAALVCYHPETLGSDGMEWTERLRDYQIVIVSGSNADIGGEAINNYWKEHHTCYYYRQTYPAKLWLSLMRHADVLIGNSSGFIFEGLTLGKRFINVGMRQQGRYEDAIAMFETEKYPFGVPGTVSKKIAEKILSLEMPARPIKYGKN